MNVTRRWYLVPAAAGTSVDSTLRGRGIWLEENAVGDRRIAHTMHNAREARIGKQRRSVREIGARDRTVAVTATVWVGWGVALAITLASNDAAGEFAHHILSIMAVLIAMMVMAVVAVSGSFGKRKIALISHCQVQMNPESGRQRRQYRHCHQQMANT